MLVNVPVVAELCDHFDDEEDDGAGDVVLHGPERSEGYQHFQIWCRTVGWKTYKSSFRCFTHKNAHPHPRAV